MAKACANPADGAQSCTQDPNAGDQHSTPAAPADSSEAELPGKAGAVDTGADGALTAQEPRLEAVLAAPGGSGHSTAPAAVIRLAGNMRPAASGELDARERGVVLGRLSAEGSASWPTPAHKCAPLGCNLMTSSPQLFTALCPASERASLAFILTCRLHLSRGNDEHMLDLAVVNMG